MTDRARRSLILAGGGDKVAFQAGVLQVWLDEAGLEFDHVDGSSGGTLNLAMYCSGLSGRQIADNWRTFSPLRAVQLNWKAYLTPFFGESLFRLDRFRDVVFPRWGLDWERINRSDRAATFNVYNFTRHRLESLPPARLTPDYLTACIALPMWFPPVQIDGERFIDSVFVTDANIEEAIFHHGADEIWVIWTVSKRGDWGNGFIANYFQIVEASANGRFRQILERIEANNEALKRGQEGEFGRHITPRVLRAEVPVNYLVTFSQDRLAEAVNRGVEEARHWCQDRDISLRPVPAQKEIPAPDTTAVSFTERMWGYIAFGEADHTLAYWEGREQGTSLELTLGVRMSPLDSFLTDPHHRATADGYLECQALGGRLPVERGSIDLLVDKSDPSRKQMIYRLDTRDGTGRPLTLVGIKRVERAPGSNVWQATTTLYLEIYRQDGEHVAAGIVSIHLPDFLRQLLTFRAEGRGAGGRLEALGRFGAFFFGRLWDVYARKVLPYAPF